MITTEQFDEALFQVVRKATGADDRIWAIPGVYEVLSEHFHNDALAVAAKRDRRRTRA